MVAIRIIFVSLSITSSLILTVKSSETPENTPTDVHTRQGPVMSVSSRELRNTCTNILNNIESSRHRNLPSQQYFPATRLVEKAVPSLFKRSMEQEYSVLGKRTASRADEDKEDGDEEQPEGQGQPVVGAGARWVICIYIDLRFLNLITKAFKKKTKKIKLNARRTRKDSDFGPP